MSQLTNLSLELPIKTVSEMNRRDHWRTVHRRKAAQAKEVRVVWKNAAQGQSIALPCRVTLTRIGAKELDDDNLRGSMKAIRDEIAWLIGKDDSPTSPISWDYKQEANGKRKYGVRIEVVSL